MKAEGDSMDYPCLINQVRALTEGVPYSTANLANTAAAIWQIMERINWAGFYLMNGGKLVLGPFQGKPACIEIPVGKGVCGTAVKEEKTILVEDVHQFPGHIACDSASNSEIVLPMMIDGQLIGVMDIDAPLYSRFDEEDAAGLEKLCNVLVDQVDWSKGLL